MFKAISRSRIVLFALIGFAIGLLLLSCRFQESTYQRHRLSFWLKELDSDSETNVAGAIQAVRAIGTNSLPILIRVVQSKPGPVERLLAPHRDRFSVVMHLSSTEERRGYAIRGFQALGAAAEPAVPTLLKGLADPEVARDSERALVAIGPASISHMTNALQGANEQVRFNIADALGIWPLADSAEPAVPSLLGLLQDSSGGVRGQAANSLGAIGKPCDLIIPALIAAFEDEEYYPRERAMSALGRLGPLAKKALPGLIKAAQSENIDEKSIAIQTIQKIDPVTATALRAETKYKDRTK